MEMEEKGKKGQEKEREILFLLFFLLSEDRHRQRRRLFARWSLRKGRRPEHTWGRAGKRLLLLQSLPEIPVQWKRTHAPHPTTTEE